LKKKEAVKAFHDYKNKRATNVVKNFWHLVIWLLEWFIPRNIQNHGHPWFLKLKTCHAVMHVMVGSTYRQMRGLPFTFRVGPSWPASSRKRLIFCSGVVKTAGDCDCFGGKWTVNHRISNHRKSKEERAKIHQASVGRDVIYFLFQFFRFFLFKENGYDQMIFKNITTIIYFKRILFSNI
jgi:hypothetical protein